MSDETIVAEVSASAALETEPPLAEAPPVPPDIWRWRVHFLDGTLMDEVAGGYVHTWEQVNWHQVRAVELIPQVAGVSNHALFVDAMAGQRAVFQRRRLIELDPNTGQQTHRPSVTILGWVQGETASYTFFHADGGVLMSSNFDQV